MPHIRKHLVHLFPAVDPVVEENYWPVTSVSGLWEQFKINEPKLEIKKSSLCKGLNLSVEDCFNGVFAKEKIEPNKSVCRYYGKFYRRPSQKNDWEYDENHTDHMYDIDVADFVLDGSAYADEIRNGWQESSTTTKPTWNFGPFLNDTRNVPTVNCKIENFYYDKELKKFFAEIRSTRSIQQGDELFWTYGKNYWDHIESET